MKRIRCLLAKEWHQLRRDPRLFGLLLIAPVIQLVVLGYAATTDVRLVALAIRDDDRTPASREYVRALASSGYFRSTPLDGPSRGDGGLLVSGRAGLILTVPRGFGAALANGRPAAVQALVDGAGSNFAVQGLNYLQKATRLYSADVALAAANARAPGLRVPSVAVESRAWYNPDLASVYFMVPAVMGLLLLVTTMIVMSMALVKERESGTMEQIIVTPLRPGELIAGKLLPFAVIGLAEITLALPVIRLAFGVPMRGSLALLYGGSFLFLLTTLGLGLFISTLVHTQQQAMLVSTFFVMMPFAMLSGFIFPVENMPAPIRFIAYGIPLKYYLAIVRGVMLKGAGLADLWTPLAVLLGWGAGILGLAILKFHKNLD